MYGDGGEIYGNDDEMSANVGEMPENDDEMFGNDGEMHENNEAPEQDDMDENKDEDLDKIEVTGKSMHFASFHCYGIFENIMD